MFKKLPPFALLFMVFSAAAQVVVRGPYLQSPNHESIKVMWRTNVPTSTKVWYGTDSLNLNQSAILNDNVENHILKITGLLPATRYYYAVGNTGAQLAGNTGSHNFKTHPLPGSKVPVRVWAIGDFGKGNAGQVQVKTSFENYTGERGSDVWIWLGDNAYDDGSDAQYQEKVFGLPGFSDIFSHLPFYSSPGNHDYNEVWAESTLLGIPYTNIPFSDHRGPYFDMVEVPRYAEAGGFPSQHEVFYSFDYGDVHFLSLNSEVFDYTLSYDGINNMKNWISQDLQQNTRKFTIAYFHQPPYSKGSHDSDDIYELAMKAMREKVIPLLESFDIDLVVCGHSHVYERSFLIKGHTGNSGSFNAATMGMNMTDGNLDNGNAYIKDNSYTTSEGTVYVVCGNSGSSTSSPSLNHPVMAYSAGSGGVEGMGSFIMDINKNRLDGSYLKSDGTIGDKFTILKKDVVLGVIQNQSICAGDSIQLTAFYTGGSDSISFAWSGTSATTQAVTIYPTTSGSQTFTVTDLLTGQVSTGTFQVNILPAIIPAITEVIPGTLGSSVGGGGYAYQWYINGNQLSGANGQYYTPLFDGNYTVTVTAPNGCVSTSDIFVFETEPSTAGIAYSNDKKISVYPNPASEQLMLFSPGIVPGTSYDFMDMNGKILSSGNIQGDYTPISLSAFGAGTYQIIMNTASGEANTITIIKQ